MLASEVMDLARSKLNDVEGQLFDNTVLLPYLKSAYDVLQSEMQNNSLPITSEVSSVITIPAGTLVLSSSSVPALPTDIIEPLFLYERESSTDQWKLMEEVSAPPLTLVEDYKERLYSWYWGEEELKFPGSTADRQVLIRYIKSLPTISGESTNLAIRGALEFLALKTAANAAEDIGQNRTRADRLESKATIELNKFINIRVKGGQDRAYRRRPYGSTRRGSWPSVSMY